MGKAKRKFKRFVGEDIDFMTSIIVSAARMLRLLVRKTLIGIMPSMSVEIDLCGS